MIKNSLVFPGVVVLSKSRVVAPTPSTKGWSYGISIVAGAIARKNLHHLIRKTSDARATAPPYLFGDDGTPGDH